MAIRKSRINIKDVAAEAGVSYAAVSAVLSGKKGTSIRVSEATRERIFEAARKLNYAPNLSARSLAAGQSDIISVFTYEPIFPFSSDNEFYPFLLGIEQEAENQSKDLLMITNRLRRSNGDNQNSDGGINRLRMADGGILLGVRWDQGSVRRLVDDGFPLVVIGRRDFGDPKPAYITFDYPAIINELIEFVYNRGHHQIVHFRQLDYHEMSEDREIALKAACDRHDGMKLSVQRKEPQHITPVLIQSLIHAGTTMFIGENLDYAEAFESAAESLGLVIGQDISAALLIDPWRGTETDWTCWTNVRHILGVEAVKMLVGMVQGNQIDTPELVKPDLIPGSTVRDITEDM